MRTWNSRQFPDAGCKGLNLPLTNGVDVMVERATVAEPLSRASLYRRWRFLPLGGRDCAFSIRSLTAAVADSELPSEKPGTQRSGALSGSTPASRMTSTTGICASKATGRPGTCVMPAYWAKFA